MTTAQLIAFISRLHWRDFLRGLVLGAIAFVLFDCFNFLFYPWFYRLMFPTALLGGLIGLTRARRILEPIVVSLLIIMGVIAFTPLTRWLPRGLDQHDDLRHCDAVVLLAGGYLNDQVMPDGSLDRVMTAMDVLRGGYTDHFLVTRPSATGFVFPDLVADLARRSGISTPVIPVGPVHNTHDESIAVARMCRENGWHSIILVTHAWHMERAAGLFKKQGLDVVRCPCVDGSYDALNPSSPQDRLTAFRYSMHEILGRAVYRLRGWL